MNDKYILVGQTPVPEPDLMTWARSMEEADRHVAVTRVFDTAVVSTVFLGLDHNFSRFRADLGLAGPPILFESMVFWDEEGGCEQDRCSTWSQAEIMHQRMVREVAAPHSYFAYFARKMRDALSQAWNELKEMIREV